MLLMQYNDNIPAVFGFPQVIPHQRRRTGEHTVPGNGWLFLSFLLLTVPPFIWSSLSGWV